MGSAWTSRIVPGATLAALVATAAAVRVGELGPPSLWNDDAWVALISRHPWSDIWFTSLTSVGFRALIGAWIAVAGASPFAAQVLPFALGLATIPATYAVARRIDTHHAAALFAASVVAASPLLATYSTRVKQYTGDALLMLAIAAAVLRILRDPGRAGRWWAFAMVSCAAIAFSGQLLLAIGPAGLIALAGSRRSWRDPSRTVLPPLVALAAFGIVWYLTVLAPAVSPALARYWADHYLVLDEGGAAAAQSVRRGIRGLLAGVVGSAALAGAGAGVLVAVALVGRPPVAVSLLLPALAALAAAAAGRSPIGARPDAYLVPLIALAMAAGLDAMLRAEPRGILGKLPRPARYAAAGLCVGAVLVGLPARAIPARYPREDVGSLTRIWEARRDERDHTFVSPGAANAFALYSHEALVTRKAGKKLARATVDDPRISMLERRLRKDPAAYSGAVLATVGGQTGRIWILAAHTRRDEGSALAEAVTARGFVLQDRWTTDGGSDLALYQRSPAR